MTFFSQLFFSVAQQTVIEALFNSRTRFFLRVLYFFFLIHRLELHLFSYFSPSLLTSGNKQEVVPRTYD